MTPWDLPLVELPKGVENKPIQMIDLCCMNWKNLGIEIYIEDFDRIFG